MKIDNEIIYQKIHINEKKFGGDIINTNKRVQYK